MYKRSYLSGIVAYVVLLVFALWFYKERIIFLDTAFSLFHIIQNNSFTIPVYRFGNVFNQWLPVLAIKTHMPLDSAVLSYSFGYMLYYFMCYLISGSVLKQYKLALVILVLNLLFVTDTFYWVTSELAQSIALLIVALAFARSKLPAAKGPLVWIVTAALLITVAFFHPLAVFVLLYAVIFFQLKDDVQLNKKTLNTICGVFMSVVIIKAGAFRNTYDHNSMSGMKNFITHFPDYFTLYSNRQFLHRCFTMYYWIPVLFAAVVVRYSRSKEWKKLWLFLLAFGGYLLLVNVSFPGQETKAFYIESLYMPLSVFLALPFIFDVLPVLEKRKLALPVLLLIMATGLLRIYNTGSRYTARLNYERAYLQKYDGIKVLAKASPADNDTLQMLWGTPYEFWLLSTIEQHKTASIVIDADPLYRMWATRLNKSLLVNWGTYPYTDLSTRYFHFTDTTTTYTLIK